MPEGDAEGLRPHPAVGLDALLAVEEDDQDQGQRRRHLGEAERDHGKRGAGATRRDEADEDAEEQPRQSAQDGEQADREIGQRLHHHPVEEVHCGIAGQPEIDGVAERQHAALAEQHVVGKREDDEDAHLAHDGHGEAGGEHPRQRDHHGGRDDPDAGASEPARHHPSRVPKRPRGRTIRTTTRSRYGSSGAMPAVVRLTTSRSAPPTSRSMPKAANRG